jgi:hypothetical protein
VAAPPTFDSFAHPLLIVVVCLSAFWIAAWVGATLRERIGGLREDTHTDLSFVIGATLTLLGMIIAFTFSMAVNRYDQRKIYEEEEANAIGTEYVRANLLQEQNAEIVRALLSRYLDQRISYYESRNTQQLERISAETARLQNQMWSAVVRPAVTQPTPVAALLVSGMNDVLNAQGYTQAAWRNRIPTGAWILVIMISVFCNLLIGFDMHRKSPGLLLILPIALSVSLFLISDIDSPRQGVIRVQPLNLISLAESVHSQ